MASPRGNRALAAAVLYAVLGGLWILFSDAVVESVARDGDTLTRLQTWKGWLFVAATAALVYWLVRGAVASEQRLSRSLREAEERLRLILDTIPSRVLWKDRVGRYLGANAQFARDAGYRDPRALIGLSDADLPWREQADAIRATDQRILSGAESRLDYELTLTDPAGRPRHEAVTKVPLRDATGAVIGVLASYEDITARKNAERQLRHAQKLQAIGELTSGVTHDFKNVLSVIIANAELVVPSLPVDSEEARAVGDILAASESAAGMIRKLLGFSREGDLAPAATDLRSIVRDLAPMLSRMLSAAYPLEVVLADDLPPVSADPDAVEQMVLNLIANARDAMPAGGRIQVRVAGPAAGWDAPLDDAPPAQLLGLDAPPPGRFVALYVGDSGHGMTAEVVERIFEPFYTTKPVGRGTGLGLAMVYGLMRQHRGFVTVRSAPEWGAIFGLHFPVAAGDESASPRRRRSPAGRLQHGSEVILLVDDQDELRRTASRVLRRYGYTVLEAAGSADALALFDQERHRINLVLSDYIMPDMNGLELLRQLRARDPSVALALSSGHADLAAATGAEAMPTVPVIAKPWTMEELVGGVRAVLDARSP